MCTLIVALNPRPGVAFIVGANRDERLDRPARGPSLRRHAGSDVLCPTDLEAGGTWWGVSSVGLFAAVTNRMGLADPSRRSRGALVLNALAAGDAGEVLAHVATVPGSDYNPFHLLVLGRQENRGVGGVLRSDGVKTAFDRLSDGVHVLTERSFDAAPDDRSPRILAGLATLDARADAATWISTIGGCLRWRGQGPRDAVDVRLDHLGYGTRSSALVVASTEGPVALAHADGPPGTPYEDLQGILDRLLRPTADGAEAARVGGSMRDALTTLDGATAGERG